MRFEYYHEPTSVNECIELLSHYGPDVCLLAGGTDLVVKLRSRAIRPKAVISLGSLEGLRNFERKSDGSVEIGAMKTLREIEQSDVLADGFDLIRQGAGHVSSVQVRNVATLGGNSCNASPSADTVPGLIASEVMARIVGSGGERLIPLEDFFKGPGKTVLGSGEILAGFHLPPFPPLTGGAYKKHSIRGNMDLAIVGVAARLTLDQDDRVEQVRVILGAVAPTPLRAGRAEEILLGHVPEEKIIEKAARAAAEDAKPISDQRGTAQYRREMVRVWTRYAIQEAFQKAHGTNPPRGSLKSL